MPGGARDTDIARLQREGFDTVVPGDLGGAVRTVVEYHDRAHRFAR